MQHGKNSCRRRRAVERRAYREPDGRLRVLRDDNVRRLCRRHRLLRAIDVKDLYVGPPRQLIRTGSVLVAADVEPVVELFREAVFADIGGASDLDDRAEADVPRTGDGIATTANIGAGSGGAGRRVGLAGDSIV